MRARKKERKTTKKKNSSKSERLLMGKAISLGVIVGVILNFLMQGVLYGMAPEASSLGASIILVLVLGGLIGLTTSLITQSSKKPLLSSVTASIISVILMQIIVSLVISALSYSEYVAVYLSAINMMSSAIVGGIAIITNAIYWKIFTPNKELDWIKKPFNDSVNIKNYISTLVVLSIAYLISYVEVGEWETFGILAVELALLSMLIAYLVGDIKKSHIVFAVSAIISIIVGIAYILPLYALQYVNSPIPAVSLFLFAMVLGIVVSVLLSLAPFLAAIGEGMTSIKLSVDSVIHKTTDVVGMIGILATLVVGLEFIVSLIVAVSGNLSTPIDILISSWIFELGIIGMGEISKKTGKP